MCGKSKDISYEWNYCKMIVNLQLNVVYFLFVCLFEYKQSSTEACLCVRLSVTLNPYESWNIESHLEADSILAYVDVCFCELSSLALTQLHVTRASERLWWQTVMSLVRGHKHFGMPTHTRSQSEERSLWWQGPWMGWFSQSCESTVCVFVLADQENIFP